MRIVYSYDGTNWFYRVRAKPLAITADHLISRYTLKPANEKEARPDYNRDEMITHTLVGSDGEVPIFWHNAPEPLYLYLGGYGLSITYTNKIDAEKQKAGIFIQGNGYYWVLHTVQAPEGKFA